MIPAQMVASSSWTTCLTKMLFYLITGFLVMEFFVFRLPAWDYSAWVRTYALFLEERLECFRVLKYDVETDRAVRLLFSFNCFFFVAFLCQQIANCINVLFLDIVFLFRHHHVIFSKLLHES